MRIVFLDIETSPNEVFTWGLWDQNISLNQIIDTSRMLCYTAKWADTGRLEFDAVWKSGRIKMLRSLHKVLSEADVVVSYNGISFDLPVVSKEFLLEGMAPPSPYKNVDLLRVVRKQFRFASNKLDHVAQQLGLGSKVKHPGFKLWVDCMAGDEAAQRLMERYNKQDVVLLERVYDKVLPWIKGHPNRSAHEGAEVCTNCGGKHLQRRGTARNAAGTYPRFQCGSCGSWMRGSVVEKAAPKRRMVSA